EVFTTSSSLVACLLVLILLIFASATTEIYTLSLHDALPIWKSLDRAHTWTRISPDLARQTWAVPASAGRYASTVTPTPRGAITRSEEHTSELQSRFDLVCRLLLEKIIFLMAQLLVCIIRELL